MTLAMQNCKVRLHKYRLLLNSALSILASIDTPPKEITMKNLTAIAFAAAKLQADGYKVVAAANPLRSVKGDADSVSGVIKGIDGPVVLVGHSYGGAVITTAAQGNANVKGLVYVAAFAPEAGENALELSGRYPGGTLGGALAAPVTLPDGGKDLYIDQAKFHDQFAADVPKAKARLMAAGQRPIAEAALKEASGAPAWKT